VPTVHVELACEASRILARRCVRSALAVPAARAQSKGPTPASGSVHVDGVDADRSLADAELTPGDAGVVQPCRCTPVSQPDRFAGTTPSRAERRNRPDELSGERSAQQPLIRPDLLFHATASRAGLPGRRGSSDRGHSTPVTPSPPIWSVSARPTRRYTRRYTPRDHRASRRHRSTVLQLTDSLTARSRI